MKKTSKLLSFIIGIALVATLAIAPVLADDAPVLPVSVYGTAKDSSGTDLAVGSVIKATVDGITSSYTITEKGKIGESGQFGTKFLVYGESDGSTIIFTYGNNAAEQTATFEPGAAIQVNLVFPVILPSYYVNYSMQGHGSQVTNTTVLSGSTISKPTDPTAAGFNFGGWFKEPTYQNAWNFATDTVTDNTTLYAKWNAKILVTSITISGDSIVRVGDNMTLTATILPDNAEDKSITWSSSASSIASVDANGRVSGVAEGVAIITATANDGSGTYSTHQVTVKPESATGLYLYPGWNFVSVPKKLAGAYDTAGELFANVDTAGNAVFAFNAETQEWVQVTPSTKISALNAYWIYSVSAMDVPYEFTTTPQVPATKPLYKGWNAVGLSANEATEANVAFNSLQWRSYLEWNGLVQNYKTPIINGGSGAYADSNKVSLWSGGWLYLSTEGTYIGLTA